MTKRFAARPEDAARLVNDQVLGLVVSHGPDGFGATPLPLLASEIDETGQVAEFFGHFARSNPQVAALQAHPRATILYQGPQAYISPGAVSRPGWAPTWNYALARFDVDIRFIPEESGRAINDLVDRLEGGNWNIDRMGDRYARMVQHVIAFRARVRHCETKFKLGQDETDDTFSEIVRHLGDGPLTTLMRRART